MVRPAGIEPATPAFGEPIYQFKKLAIFIKINALPYRAVPHFT